MTKFKGISRETNSALINGSRCAVVEEPRCRVASKQLFARSSLALRRNWEVSVWLDVTQRKTVVVEELFWFLIVRRIIYNGIK